MRQQAAWRCPIEWCSQTGTTEGHQGQWVSALDLVSCVFISHPVTESEVLFIVKLIMYSKIYKPLLLCIYTGVVSCTEMLLLEALLSVYLSFCRPWLKRKDVVIALPFLCWPYLSLCKPWCKRKVVLKVFPFLCWLHLSFYRPRLKEVGILLPFPSCLNLSLCRPNCKKEKMLDMFPFLC